MKRCALFMLCLCISIISFSQTSTNPNNNNGIEAYFGIGGTYNNYSNLNGTFKNASLPSVPKFNLGVMAEADLRFKNLLVGINSNSNAYQKKSGNYNSSVRSVGGGINVGYNIVNAKNFHLAPQAGIGLVSSALNITQRKNIGSFNEVLSAKNGIDINQTAGVLDFCLKFDFADYTKTKSYITIIKLGYKYGLSNRGWGIDETSTSTIDDSPKDRMRQVYLMLCIGTSRLKSHA